MKPQLKKNTISSLVSAIFTAIPLSSLCITAQADEKTLSTVNVIDQAEIAQPSMLGTTTRVGKIAQDPHDIPQAVTTITNTIMEEQQAGSLKEALRNVSGLTFNAAEGGRAGDNMMLRGFYTFGDMYLDGIRDTAQYNREIYALEQVDVLRGAGAMLFGRGQAGGVINQVSKAPFLLDKNKMTFSLGTDEYSEVTGDFNKRLGESSALRVNVMKRDEGSWRSNPATGAEPTIDRQGISVSLGLGLGTTDEFVLTYLNTKTDDIPDYGFPFSNMRPSTTYAPNTFWGIDQNFDKSDTTISTATYTKRMGTLGEIRTTLRQGEYDRSYWASAPSNGTAPNANGGSAKTRASWYDTTTLQSDYSNKITLAGMQHQVLAGVEYLHEKSKRGSLKSFTAATSPTTYYLPYQVSSLSNQFDSDSYAIYAQDTVEFVPKWKATLGARRDYMDANYISANKTLKFGEWSTRGALSYHPDDQTHYYLGYSDSFSPTGDLYQLDGSNVYPAERSQVTELGAKWLLMSGDLALRAALYRANKDWERNSDLEANSSVLTKKRRTDGVEFEIAGRVTSRWEMFAGLALMDAKMIEMGPYPTRDLSAYVGQTPRNTPDYTLNIWNTYKFDAKWKGGLGIETKGKRTAYDPTGERGLMSVFDPNTAPSYVRWDAMVAYEMPTWAARINIQNLFDKTWYDAIYDQGGFVIPGQGRRVIVTVEYKF